MSKSLRPRLGVLVQPVCYARCEAADHGTAESPTTPRCMRRSYRCTKMSMPEYSRRRALSVRAAAGCEAERPALPPAFSFPPKSLSSNSAPRRPGASLAISRECRNAPPRAVASSGRDDDSKNSRGAVAQATSPAAHRRHPWPSETERTDACVCRRCGDGVARSLRSASR
jgi:hypothetical protein